MAVAITALIAAVAVAPLLGLGSPVARDIVPGGDTGSLGPRGRARAQEWVPPGQGALVAVLARAAAVGVVVNAE